MSERSLFALMLLGLSIGGAAYGHFSGSVNETALVSAIVVYYFLLYLAIRRAEKIIRRGKGP